MNTPTTTLELDSIKMFLHSFSQKEHSLLMFKIMHEIPAQKSFLNNFVLIEKIALKLIENEAPKFNIFNILNINHLEAKVHTPFLAELLNPNGSHKQGRLFFNAFMKHLFSDFINSENIYNITVTTEMFDYSNGRMDIVIRYIEKEMSKEIVIENKIYHHDEKEQLTRYYQYLTQTRCLKNGQYHLIYLTPYKNKPTVHSINKSLYNSLVEIKALSEWGYYQDIAPILEQTLSHIKAPVVMQTVHQYIETIQQL